MDRGTDHTRLDIGRDMRLDDHGPAAGSNGDKSVVRYAVPGGVALTNFDEPFGLDLPEIF